MKTKWLVALWLLLWPAAMRAQEFQVVVSDTLTRAGLEAVAGTSLDSVRLRAEAGDAAAQCLLGAYLTHGAERNMPEACRWLQKGCDGGIVGAANLLGEIYYEGDGVIRDLRRAMGYFLHDAERGMPDAMYNAAVAYAQGLGTARQADSAFCWARRGAEADHAGCMLLLSSCYYQGVGTAVDKAAAFRWAYRAANSGEPEAMQVVASFLASGEAVEANLDKALEWAARADSLGVAGAAELRGRIEKAREADRRFLKYGLTQRRYLALPDAEYVAVTGRMAQDGDAEAQYDMASFYYGGHHGVRKDYKKARYWYREAARNGYDHARDTLRELGW